MNIWNGVEKATAHPVGIVLVGVRAAQHVQVLHVLGQFIRVAVEELVLVDRAVGSALTGRAVVGRVEDDGVLELTGLLQVVDDAADLGVGVLRESGVDLSQAARTASSRRR